MDDQDSVSNRGVYVPSNGEELLEKGAVVDNFEGDRKVLILSF